MKLLLESWRRYLLEDKNKFPFQIYVDLDGVLVNFEGGVIETINKDLEDPDRVKDKIEELTKLPDPNTARRRTKRLEKKYRQLLDKIYYLRPDDPKVILADISRDVEERGEMGNSVRNYMYERLQDDEDFWSDLEWLDASYKKGQDGKKLWDHVKGMDPPPIILTAPMKQAEDGGDHKGKRKWVLDHLGKEVPIIVEKDKWKYAIDDTGAQNVLIDDTYSKIESWKAAGGFAVHHVGSVDDTIAELDRIKENSDVPEEPLR